MVFRLEVWARDDVKHDGETISTPHSASLYDSNTIVTNPTSGGRSNLFRSIGAACARPPATKTALLLIKILKIRRPQEQDHGEFGLDLLR